MLSTDDLLKVASDADATSEGRIKAASVDGCAKIVVKLDSWGIVVLPRV